MLLFGLLSIYYYIQANYIFDVCMLNVAWILQLYLFVLYRGTSKAYRLTMLGDMTGASATLESVTKGDYS